MSADNSDRAALARSLITGPALLRHHNLEVAADTLEAAAVHAAGRRGLHEVRPAGYQDGPAAAGFLCALTAMAAASRPGAIVWIAQHGGGLDFGFPYGPGLAQLGLDPRRLLLVRAARDADALWAAEEAAKAHGVAAIFAQALDAISLTAARRLHLAAAQSVFLGLLRPARAEGMGPALSRWSAAGAQGTSARLTRWATPRWRVSLDRRRDGPGISAHILEWDHGAHRLRLGALLGVQAPDGRGQTSDVRHPDEERAIIGAMRRAG